MALVENAHGILNFVGIGMFGRSEIREGDHRHPRIEIEAPRRLRRLHRDLRQLLCAWVNVDGGIGEHQHLILEHQQVRTGDVLHTRFRLDHLQCGPHSRGVVSVQSGDDSVGVALLDHHHREVVAAVQNLSGVGHGDATPAAKLMEALRVLLVLRRLENVDDGDARAVDAMLCEQRRFSCEYGRL